MNRLKKQVTTSAKHVVESWITWVALGAAAGTGVLFSAGLGASETGHGAAPSGLEIETAVAQAEAQANAARATRPSR
jgi:hypothetical protein